MIIRFISATTSENFEKTGLLLIGPGGITACLGPHSEAMGETEIDREREKTWGSTFLGVEGRAPRFSWVHSLLLNLKHSSWQ